MTDFFLHTGGLINLLSTVNASLTALCLFITSVPATPMVASSKHGLKSRDGGDWLEKQDEKESTSITDVL